jgi:hypothetical protein
MKKLVVVLGVALITSFNAFSQKIDIHVTQVSVRESADGLLDAEYSMPVNSYYFINLDAGTLVYQSPKYDIDVSRRILSKEVIGNIITIVYEDDGFNPTMVIDKSTNSVNWINQDSSAKLTYEFRKFSMEIKEKS